MQLSFALAFYTMSSAIVFQHFPSAQLSALQFFQSFFEPLHSKSEKLLTNNRELGLNVDSENMETGKNAGIVLSLAGRIEKMPACQLGSDRTAW